MRDAAVFDNPFDIAGPLPGPGRTVIEASAGTGKTYAVAALATRYVAEAVVDLDQLLLITFSRAATAELRDRVRARFAQTALALGRELRADDDELIQLLRAADADEVERRRRRLLDALANYDSATIATTHEFCNAVLRSLGVAGNRDSNITLLADVTGLREEVVGDLYLARYLDTLDPKISYSHANRVAQAAIDNVHAALHDDIGELAGDEQDVAAERIAFALDARKELERRKRRLGLITYDDMLSRLADALESDESAAAQRMRARWKVVLVDEFQDTDPVQWQVLDRAFGEDSRLILIGDPKQAIYAFRGGDTPTYLQATEGAAIRTLPINWRSDGQVVTGLAALLGGASLGDERIVVHPVSAGRVEQRLHGLVGGVRLRQLRRGDFEEHERTRTGLKAGVWRTHVARDVAHDIARTLAAGATYLGRPVSAGDIAVLVSEHREAAPIQAELDRLGIASVLTSPVSVMSGPASGSWQTLLQAMEAPHRAGLVRAAAMGPFFGYDAIALAAGDDDLTDLVAERLRSWFDLFRTHGVAGIVGAVQAAGVTARLLGRPGGERTVTDLFHVGQLLHQAAVEGRLGLSGLLAWLRDAIEEGDRSDTRRRRLDVDADAVQFVTIHGSKGLEYPFVYLPNLFDRYIRDRQTIHSFHLAGKRMLDVSNTPTGQALAREEDAQERLRMAYVAMTRATEQLVMWWAPSYNCKHGPLTRLLFGRAPDAAEVAVEVEVPADQAGIDAVLERWAARGAFRVEPSQIGPAPARARPALPPELHARPWTRTVDLAWRRTSYSGLIRAEEQVATASEPEDPGTVDEDTELEELLEPAGEVSAPAAEGAIESPMNGIRGGATFGSLLHAVLEHADPEAADLRAELATHIEDQRRWWAVEAETEELVDALLPMQHTPLGPLAGNLTLAQIPVRDRLRELGFEFPMAGGDRIPPALGEAAGDADGSAGNHADAPLADQVGLPLAAMATAIRSHLPEGDPIRGYADKLDNPSLGQQVLRGYLSGSIDVVLRVHAAGGDRFVVVDYKTNSLGAVGEPMTTADYTPAKVAEAMVHSHYPLQALLYSVVLHRYLRWRLPDYDPERHLGGVLYLYVRGMVGPQTPVVDGVPCGVFSWLPPVGLILDLSAILDGQEVAHG